MKMKILRAYISAVLTVLLTPALLLAAHDEANSVRVATAGELSKIETAGDHSKVAAAFAKLPLSFEKNVGQTDPSARYMAHGQDYQLFLTSEEAVLALRRVKPVSVSPADHVAYLEALRESQKSAEISVLRLQFAHANPFTEIDGVNLLPGKTNYFTGNDPKNWHTDVPSYGRVTYREIYPGTDLVFYGNQRRLEYDFVVAPGADPKAVALNVKGARNLRVDSEGNLVLTLAVGDVQFEKPIVYQEVNGERREIAANYTIAKGDRVGFALSNYDATKPLIIDPVLNYSTYLGGSSTGDIAYGIAVDANGDSYITGQTFNMTFPTSGGATQSYSDSPDAGVAMNGAVFVSEINPAGTQALYFTYLSGSGAGISTEYGGAAIALDPAPTTNCPNGSNPGICVYITGTTLSTNFPTTPITAITPGPLGSNPGTTFLTKLNPAVSGINSLVYSTYLGGTGGDFGEGIAVDSSSYAYEVGFTASTDFVQPAVPNGYQTSLPMGNGAAFLAKVDTTGLSGTGTASLLYFTYLGGNGANSGAYAGFQGDQANAVAIDSTGKAYLAGVTSSTNFPVAGMPYESALPMNNTNDAAFFSVVNTGGSGTATLVYSTYLAGRTADQANGIALKSCTQPCTPIAYVTGKTTSSDFPATMGAYPSVSSSQSLAFVTLFDISQSGANSLKYSTSVGGTDGDVGYGIAVDAQGNAYVAGSTDSADFAGVTNESFESTRVGSGGDAFVFELSPAGNGPADLIYSSYFGGAGSGANPDQARAIAISQAASASCPTAQGTSGVCVYLTGVTYSDPTTFPLYAVSPGPFESALPGGTTSAAFVAKLNLIPRLPVSPTSLNFNNQVVGVQSAAQTVTLANNTSSTITFSAPTITAGSPAASGTDFAAANGTCATPLAPGGSCTVSVTFTASTTSNESATLNVNSSDASSPVEVALTSTSTQAAVVTVSLSPTSVTFSNQVVGITSSPAITLTITNTGNAPLNFTAAPSITGTGGTPSTDFAIVTGSGTTCTNGATVQPNATCTIALTFSPSGTSPNPRTANLVLTDNATGSPQDVALSGTAVASAPMVGFSPQTTLTFTSQVVNTTSAAQTVTVTNTGNAALNLTAAPAISGTNATDFSIVAGLGTTCTSGAVVQATQSCTIAITFTPSGTTPDPRTASLVLTDNATPMGTLAISGTAAAAAAGVTLTPSSLTFTGQLVTTTSAAQTVTVKNTGNTALTLTAAPLIGGANAAEFAIASGSGTTCTNGATVQANATCTISVTFTPASATTDPRTATLSIADNAAGSPQTAALTGTAWDYTVTASTPAAINPGQSASIPVTVIGLGGYTGSVSFSCSGSIPGGSCVAPSPVNAAPAPGATATFTISTTSFVTPTPSRRIPPTMPKQMLLLMAALVALLAMPIVRRSRTRLGLIGAMVLFISLAGCSSNSSSSTTTTPAGPYTFSIAASSGGVNHSVNVVVTVN